MVGQSIIGFYDGRDLYVYDPQSARITQNIVDDNYTAALMVHFPGGLGFYDGDDLIVYDLAKRRFYSNFAYDNYAGAALAAFQNGVLFYDGDDVYAYCNGSFGRQSADNGLIGKVIGRGPIARGLAVGNTIFRLTKDCKIQN